MIDTYDAQYDVTSMYTMFPWDSPYDEEGNLVPDRYSGWVDSSDTNYLNALANGDHTDYKTYEFSGNFDFDIKFTDWLTFTSVNSYRYRGYYYSQYTDPNTRQRFGCSGTCERIPEQLHAFVHQPVPDFQQAFRQALRTGIAGL